MAAFEILVATQAIKTMIREGKGHQVNNVIMTGKKEGMKLLDQYLKELIHNGLVTGEEAARYSEEPETILGFARSGGKLPPDQAPPPPGAARCVNPSGWTRSSYGWATSRRARSTPPSSASRPGAAGSGETWCTSVRSPKSSSSTGWSSSSGCRPSRWTSPPSIRSSSTGFRCTCSPRG